MSLALAPPSGATLVSVVELARRLKIMLPYWWRHGRWPDVERPHRFTEWVQWRKLNDRSAALARLTDKLEAKEHAARRGCGDLCVPTVWTGTILPHDPPAPYPLVVKARHGCNQYIVIDDARGWAEARRRSRRWMARSYGNWLGEHHYRSAQRGLIVEPFIGDTPSRLPDDYKVYVFGGRAAIVQHHVGRGSDHRWTQYDRDWTRVGGARTDSARPASLEAMIEAAERLCTGHDFLRADFYDVGGRLWFGEFCLYPGSGLDPFTPDDLDLALGKRWTAASLPGSP